MEVHMIQQIERRDATCAAFIRTFRSALLDNTSGFLVEFIDVDVVCIIQVGQGRAARWILSSPSGISDGNFVVNVEYELHAFGVMSVIVLDTPVRVAANAKKFCRVNHWDVNLRLMRT
jgi:hypothetical protein